MPMLLALFDTYLEKLSIHKKVRLSLYIAYKVFFALAIVIPLRLRASTAQ